MSENSAWDSFAKKTRKPPKRRERKEQPKKHLETEQAQMTAGKQGLDHNTTAQHTHSCVISVAKKSIKQTNRSFGILNYLSFILASQQKNKQKKEHCNPTETTN